MTILWRRGEQTTVTNPKASRLPQTHQAANHSLLLLLPATTPFSFALTNRTKEKQGRPPAPPPATTRTFSNNKSTKVCRLLWKIRLPLWTNAEHHAFRRNQRASLEPDLSHQHLWAHPVSHLECRVASPGPTLMDRRRPSPCQSSTLRPKNHRQTTTLSASFFPVSNLA